MPDVPGEPGTFCTLQAEQNPNIILFQYDRVQADLDIGEASSKSSARSAALSTPSACLDDLSRQG